jgi:hypothetical protein
VIIEGAYSDGDVIVVEDEGGVGNSEFSRHFFELQTGESEDKTARQSTKANKRKNREKIRGYFAETRQAKRHTQGGEIHRRQGQIGGTQRKERRRTASGLGTLKRPRTCLKTEELWRSRPNLLMGLTDLGAALGWAADVPPPASSLLILDATSDASFLLPVLAAPALAGHSPFCSQFSVIGFSSATGRASVVFAHACPFQCCDAKDGLSAFVLSECHDQQGVNLTAAIESSAFTFIDAMSELLTPQADQDPSKTFSISLYGLILFVLPLPGPATTRKSRFVP